MPHSRSTDPPDDEELTLHLYGEHPAPDTIERALAADPELARRWERLRRELGALAEIEPPEPRAGLEGRIWHRLAPELARPSRPWRAAFGRPGFRLAFAGVAAAALVAIGFLAGRVAGPPEPASRLAHSEPDPAPPPGPVPPVRGDAPLAAETRERLLAASLAAHLGSSERLLVEVANAPASAEELAAEERRMAGALLESNRLYRIAAERAGQRRLAALLAELEPLLAELAHAGAAGDVAAARDHLESRDLLFKVRVTRSRI
jgi:hypothetical protein